MRKNGEGVTAMTIELPADLAELVNEKLENGAFATPIDVVRDALEGQSETDVAWMTKAELKNAIPTGIEQADRGDLIPGEEVGAAQEQKGPEVTWLTTEQLRREVAIAVEQLDRGEHTTYPDGAAVAKDVQTRGRARLAQRTGPKR
jgi:Arc/MetJ-type ribon-helix-helix transcriptional regulator